MKSNKSIIIGVLPSFTVTLIILGLILIFNPSFPILLIGLALWIVSKAVYKKKTFRATTGELLGLIIVLSIVKLSYELLGTKGLWSLLFVVFFLAGVILWRNRKNFLDVIRDIEKQYFGETAEERKARLKK